jgi:uncharacterized protein GlcG (DUF336 family)
MTQLVFEKSSITLEAAELAIDAALKKAAEMKVAVAVAITDEAGNLRAFKRMVGCSILAGKVAFGKAFTAATSGFDTGPFFDFIKNDLPLLHGIPNLPDLVVFGGGYQIAIDGHGVIGAIGVSGGHYSEDEAIAKVGFQAVVSA